MGVLTALSSTRPVGGGPARHRVAARRSSGSRCGACVVRHHPCFILKRSERTTTYKTVAHGVACSFIVATTQERGSAGQGPALPLSVKGTPGFEPGTC